MYQSWVSRESACIKINQFPFAFSAPYFNCEPLPFSFDLNICIGQGAYICGEETALIASIEGRRAEVDVRPPFPVTEGLYKKLWEREIANTIVNS